MLLSIFYICQPQTGVLGTHKKAVVFEMVQNGKEFPDGYFWEVNFSENFVFGII